MLSLDPHSFNEAVQLSFLNNVFEALATRGKDLKLTPSLATAWKATGPNTWRFELRRKVSDFVVELETSAPNPILPELMTNVLIMNRKWAESNQATRPVDRRKGIENAASFRANGTGPFKVRERQPSQKTVLQRSPTWWNKFETNLDEVIFLPIENSATRVAALLSGEVDVIDPVPLQDIPRVNSSPKLQVVENPELRMIFLGFDHKRDVLPLSNVTDKNPFKDKRVRQAFYQAIDIQTIKTQIMRNASKPTGAMIATGIQGYSADMEPRLAFDLAASKKLHADDIGHIPLHQQTLAWGMKKTIDAYQRADGFMLFKWMNVR